MRTLRVIVGTGRRFTCGAACLLSLFATLAVVRHAEAAGNPYATVRLLYLIPQDRAYRADYATAIQEAAVSVRSFYLSQLGDRTFSLGKSSPLVETCRLPQVAAYYLADTYSKVFADAQSFWALDQPDRSPRYSWVVYADVDHGCNAPGRLGVGSPGITMLDSADLHGLVGERVIDGCGVEFFQPKTRYVGGLGHELGHVFGLPHPPGCDQGLPTCDANALMCRGTRDIQTRIFARTRRRFCVRLSS